jgi:kynureninase
MNTSHLEQARLLDETDELAAYRGRFTPIDPDLIYLDGNSLGRLPLATPAHLGRVIQQEWGDRLIRAWNEGWIDLPQRVGAKIAGIIGAAPHEVLVADSTSVNLFKLALSALQLQKDRTKIITDDLNFPSDLYILAEVCKLAGRDVHLQVIPSDGIHGALENLLEAIDEETALVSLSHVAFKSGYLYDMTAVNTRAREQGALTLWDLSHSVGVVPMDMHTGGADLAVGCTYKYLNGGPGAPAFLYARGALHEHLHNPIPGWMGHQALFDFDLAYRPAPGLRRFLSGTPSILALSAVEKGVDLIAEAGISAIRAKSLRLGRFLSVLWQAELEPLGFYLNSPHIPEHRGSHLALGHTEGLRIDLALIAEMNVLPDFRGPDTIRLGMAPLYTTFAELATAVDRLRTIVLEKRYENYSPQHGQVT